MITAQQPFQFATASYLTRVENYKVETISGLRDGMTEACDDTVFYHTFQTLGRHHFLTEGFSNDFAQWALESLNQPVLAERLASIDIRDYLTIDDLRKDLRSVLGAFCEQQPAAAAQRAFEPFY